MTNEEKHLWYDFFKRIPYNVRRQHNIKNYIVDFYVARKKLVIEIDGIQHTMHEHETADLARDADLAAMGIKVLRYSNDSVRKNFSWVVQDIMDNLELTQSDLRQTKSLLLREKGDHEVVDEE